MRGFERARLNEDGVAGGVFDPRTMEIERRVESSAAVLVLPKIG